MSLPPWFDGEEEEEADTTPQVTMGASVEVELIDESGAGERLALVVVPDKQADFGRGFLGAGTPLGRALLGQRPGSLIGYNQDDIREVRIVSVAPGAPAPKTGADASRQAVIQKALEKSDLEDALRLALTVDVKWGKYDPEALAPDAEAG
ncbi:MAG: GreA/GreB family elongation factor [Anaerolineae bacterium]|nr:GreA/GreB family elongation factor [Anaerolineae bacterium]